MEAPLRLGLVLGAGGIAGASYLVGALVAIRDETGWEPALADRVVGTSAGAFVAAIEAAGIPYGLTYARCTDDDAALASYSAEMLDLSARMDRHNEGPWFSRYPPRARVPRPLLASPALVRRAFRTLGEGERRAMLLTGLLGEGWLSNLSSIGAVIRTGVPFGWSVAPLWVVSLDLDRGRRVIFGAPSHPRPDLHVAVSAATAIPGVFAPVMVEGRRHCDAGLYSPANLDVVAGLGLDAVLCINPLTGGMGGRAHRPRFGRMKERLGGLWRASEQLAKEREAVEARGTRVYLLEPSSEDREHFPVNPMDLGARAAVMRRARETTAARIRSERALSPLVDLLRSHVERRSLDHAQESL